MAWIWVQNVSANIYVVSYHFARGGQGFLVRHLSGNLDNLSVIRNIYLYRITDPWSTFQLISSFPRLHLPNIAYPFGNIFSVQVINGFVKFAVPSASLPHRSSHTTWQMAFPNDPVPSIYRYLISLQNLPSHLTTLGMYIFFFFLLQLVLFMLISFSTWWLLYNFLQLYRYLCEFYEIIVLTV